MTQQDPTFFNQTRQQPVVPPMYAQQQVQKVSVSRLDIFAISISRWVSILNVQSIYDVSSPSAYVNPSSISQQQQLANHSLIQNGTTYFQMEQHNRNKYQWPLWSITTTHSDWIRGDQSELVIPYEFNLPHSPFIQSGVSL